MDDPKRRCEAKCLSDEADAPTMSSELRPFQIAEARTEDGDVARRRLDQTGSGVDERRLARATRSNECNAFARTHRDGDAVECNDVSVSNGESIHDQGPWIGFHCDSLSR